MFTLYDYNTTVKYKIINKSLFSSLIKNYGCCCILRYFPIPKACSAIVCMVFQQNHHDSRNVSLLIYDSNWKPENE